MSEFSGEDWLRYTRHIQLAQIGVQGQRTLKASRVLIVGAGGLGSPVALYLAAAGVGYLRLCDDDRVELSNLQRQILFDSTQEGQLKVEAAAERLSQLNPGCDLDLHEEGFHEANAERLIQDIDLVLDCTDNFRTRYLINDLCLRMECPWLYASIHQFSGQIALFEPGHACFRCVFPEAPDDAEDCNSAGVLGVLPGLLGTLQANEALKHLLGLPTPLSGNLMLVDALNLHFQRITLQAAPDCLCQSENHADAPKPSRATTCARPQHTLAAEAFDEYRTREGVRVLDIRSDSEISAFHLGGQPCSLEQLEAVKDEFAKEETLLCYCQSGKRSEEAVQRLHAWGYTAISVDGGIAAVLKARRRRDTETKLSR